MTLTSTALTAKTILEHLGSGTLPDWHRVEAAIRIKDMMVGNRLFRADNSHPYVYFVNHGMIKMVYETVDGKEWIKAFAKDIAGYIRVTPVALSRIKRRVQQCQLKDDI